MTVETRASAESSRFLSGLVRAFLVEGLGLDPADSEAVRFRLAVVEALTNVHRHAYPADRPGPVSLAVHREEDSLVAVIRDRGATFDPKESGTIAMPRPEQLAEGGYGLAIVTEVMDEIRHRRLPDRGNELTLSKRLWK
jgi:serine/threonine-protein kinase RsbW